MTLPKKNRIISRNDYQRVFKEGKTVKSSFFFIKFLFNSLGYSRWGISVPAKTVGKSVVRNRIRRKISGAVRELQNFSLDAVIIASETILEKSPAEIKSQIEQIIKKISVNH